jgi:hypothetical protein
MKLGSIMCGAAIAAFSIGCGGKEEPAIIDDFPADTTVPASANVSWQLEETMIDAADEAQICHYLDETTEEMWVTSFDSAQGKFGHHLIIFKARITEPPGTIRDCTSAEDMVRLSPIISSVQFGLERFPEGMAIRIPRGTQIVLQQHYVNTTDKPIRVRDVAWMETVPAEQVQIPAGFFGLGNIDFELTPTPGVEQTVEFDCFAPRDMKILLAGPHMHEWGVRFSAKFGRPEALDEIIKVDPWEAWMRDEPPVTNWSKEAPYELAEGSMMKTSCTFNNTTGKKLIFPHEMCATYGYYFPAPNGSEEFTCGGSSN